MGKAEAIKIATSERRAKDHAIKLGWESRMVPSLGGKGGKRTEYCPPADIQKKISAYLADRPYFFDHRTNRARSKSEQYNHELRVEQSRAGVEDSKEEYAVPLSNDALFEKQVGWSMAIIKLALIVRNLPQFVKASDDLHQRVALLSYRFVYFYCDGDLLRINTVLKDRERISALIHQAYEADCLQRGIEPGSDLKNIPWYQIHRKII